MKPRSLAAFTVLAVTGATALACLPAQAVTGVLYVNNEQGVACSDTGPATAAQPLCTVKAAAAIVQPGQTVVISPGQYPGPVDVTRSGTPGAPITFTSTSQGTPTISTSSGPAVTVSGAHDIVFNKLQLRGTGGALTISDSSNVQVQHTLLGGPVRVSGTSAAVSVTRSMLANVQGAAISLTRGVSGTVVAENILNSPGGTLLSASGATGSVVTGNTVASDCGDLVSLTAGSTGAVVENNIFTTLAQGQDVCPTPAPGAAQIDVSADSTAGSMVDYNIVHPYGTVAPYAWAGTPYATPTALQAQTGQGQHDLDTDPLIDANHVPQQGSPAIDSADAGAPGEETVDYNGNPRVDDPTVANTGTGNGYVDRGAIERQDPYYLTGATATPASSSAPTTVTVTAHESNPWSDTGVVYTFDFGDGSKPITSSTPTMSHPYTTGLPAGQAFLVTVRAVTPDGITSQTSTQVQVSPPAPLAASVAITQAGPADPLGVQADTSGSTSPWPITSRSIDFGDHSPAVTDSLQAGHTYTQPGTYQITVTETDADGRTATTSSPITVGSAYVPDGPVRVLDTRTGIGTAVGKVAPGATIRLKVTGTDDVPATGVTSVVVNLTATQPSGAGFVTAHPGGSATPGASNLNFPSGATVANLVTVPVAADGTIALTNSRSESVHLIADLEGYTTTNNGVTQAGYYTAAAPQRLLDTRSTNPVHTGALGAGQTLRLPVASQMPGGTTAAVLRVTATAPTAAGFVTAFGAGTVPTASTEDFATGQTVTNLVVVPVAADGTIGLYNHAGNTQLVVDLVGAYTTTPHTVGRPFTPTSPVRLVDTRTGIGAPIAPLASGRSLQLMIAGRNGIPANATDVVVNLTATNASTATFLTAYADQTGQPLTSTLNIAPGHTVPTLAVIPIGPDGCIRIANHAGTTDLIVDLQGYYTP